MEERKIDVDGNERRRGEMKAKIEILSLSFNVNVNILGHTYISIRITAIYAN